MQKYRTEKIYKTFGQLYPFLPFEFGVEAFLFGEETDELHLLKMELEVVGITLGLRKFPFRVSLSTEFSNKDWDGDEFVGVELVAPEFSMLSIEVFDEEGSPTDFVLAGVFAVSGISFNRVFWAEIIHLILVSTKAVIGMILLTWVSIK